MQGGAMELAAQAAVACAEAGPPDALLATDMVNLPAFLALARGLIPAGTPVLLYMHENQLTYPWREGEKPDLTYAMINWLSQLCATQVAFNSNYHRQAWFAALPDLLKHFPDYTHLERIAGVQAQRLRAAGGHRPAGPCPTGAQRRPAADPLEPALGVRQAARPLLPRSLPATERRASTFRLAVAGENFRKVPGEFEEARTPPARPHRPLGLCGEPRSLPRAAGPRRPGDQHGGTRVLRHRHPGGDCGGGVSTAAGAPELPGTDPAGAARGLSLPHRGGVVRAGAPALARAAPGPALSAPRTSPTPAPGPPWPRSTTRRWWALLRAA